VRLEIGRRGRRRPDRSETDVHTTRRAGTVYGTLLNHRDALAALGAAVHEAPYKAPPRAAVLYIKPRNTWVGPGDAVIVPAGVAELEIGATPRHGHRPAAPAACARPTRWRASPAT